MALFQSLKDMLKEGSIQLFKRALLDITSYLEVLIFSWIQ
jgi:hypothetical protein